MAMDNVKKMMEKWGWSKGQGLGKDNSGITSCLVMTKNDGSANQGRISKSSGPVDISAKKRPQGGPVQGPQEDPALLSAFYASIGIAPPTEEPASKKARTDGEDTLALVDDPDALIAKYGNVADNEPDVLRGDYGAPKIVDGKGSEWILKPRERKKLVRQWVHDDWRWSKGTEALRCFEEMTLPNHLKALAMKVLGEGSRFPARITDDTDCIVQLTAWNTVILRPRGTGADINLAKRMLFKVMHPGEDELRDDVMIEQDQDAEDQINDATHILEGLGETLNEEEFLFKERFKDAVDRNAKKGKLKNVGLGGQAEAEADVELKTEQRELPLATSEDVILVKHHLSDLRIATCVTASIFGSTLKIVGKPDRLDQAQRLVTTLMETGEWVALTETFLQAEAKSKKEAEGPVEQILIKIPEGKSTQIIGQYLKAIERAAKAKTLKLSSKPVGGKRTLMVEGTKQAHERVKLMAKELSATGESAMLTKHLNSKDAGKDLAPVSRQDASGVISAAPALVKDEVKKEEIKLEPQVKVEKVEVKEERDDDGNKIGTAKPAKPGMRHMPAPKITGQLAVDHAKMEAEKFIVDVTKEDEPEIVGDLPDLFVGLPAEVSVTGSSSASPGDVPSFPPVPPSGEVAAAASGTFPPVPPDIAAKPKEVVEAADQELIDFIGGITE